MSVYKDALKKLESVDADIVVRKQPHVDDARYPYPQDFMHLVDRVLESKQKFISFSAARAGEGTSYIAAEFAFVLSQNLARSLEEDEAKSDRVLLVEVQLIENGAAETDKEDGPDEAKLARSLLYTRDQLPGVDYIRACPVSQAPLEFVNQMWRYHEKTNFFGKWQIVIFDCPALLENRETLAITRRSDVSILVVEHSRNKREVIELAANLLRRGGNLGGVVLNKRKMRIPDWLYRMT